LRITSPSEKSITHIIALTTFMKHSAFYVRIVRYLMIFYFARLRKHFLVFLIAAAYYFFYKGANLHE